MNQKIADEINRIADEHSGHVTPNLVVEAARNPDSALHSYFDQQGCWDPQKAQEKFCLAVARRLIKTVYVEVKTTRVDLTAPAYVRDPAAAHKTQGYISTVVLRNDTDLAREAVVREFRLAAAAMARAKAIAAALNLENAVEELHAKIELFLRETEHDGGGSVHLS